MFIKPVHKKTVVIIIIVTVVGAALGIYIVNSFMGRASSEAFDDMLVRVAGETNATLPVMIDKETRLDATTAGAGKRFIYSYTLVNFSRGEVDTSALRKSMEPSLIANYQSNPQMKDFRDENVELVYQYKDRNGEFLLEIAVNPSAF